MILFVGLSLYSVNGVKVNGSVCCDESESDGSLGLRTYAGRYT